MTADDVAKMVAHLTERVARLEAELASVKQTIPHRIADDTYDELHSVNAEFRQRLANVEERQDNSDRNTGSQEWFDKIERRLPLIVERMLTDNGRHTLMEQLATDNSLLREQVQTLAESLFDCHAASYSVRSTDSFDDWSI